ncbi:MAG: MFS transporter [Anaerolineaceae bacterium]|nr:MFS transporter [Anaerolineaceae bacterium]
MENKPQKDIKNWVLNFIPVWVAQLFSLLGSLLAQYAIIWWLTLESGSAAVMATSTLFGMLPAVLFGPFVGTLVDRFNRKWIMIVSDMIIAGLVVLLIVLFRLDLVQYWHIYLLMALRSIGSAFHGAALNASISLMVPEKHLTRVSGINQSMMGVMAILAPPAAAILLANPALSFPGVISIDVITALIAIISIAFVIVPQPPAKAFALDMRTFFSETREVFPYILQWKGLRNLLLVLMAFSFFFMPLNSLESLFVLQYLQQDMTAFSIIETTFGIGFMLGGVILGVWGGFKRKVITILTAMLGIGFSLLLHAVTPPDAWWIAAAAMAICGFLLPIMNGPVYAILQSVIDVNIQGRVFALQNSLNSAVSVLALLLIGLFADMLSVQQILLISSLGAITIAIWGFLNSSIRHVEENRQNL